MIFKFFVPVACPWEVDADEVEPILCDDVGTEWTGCTPELPVCGWEDETVGTTDEGGTWEDCDGAGAAGMDACEVTGTGAGDDNVTGACELTGRGDDDVERLELEAGTIAESICGAVVTGIGDLEAEAWAPGKCLQSLLRLGTLAFMSWELPIGGIATRLCLSTFCTVLSAAKFLAVDLKSYFAHKAFNNAAPCLSNPMLPSLDWQPKQLEQKKLSNGGRCPNLFAGCPDKVNPITT